MFWVGVFWVMFLGGFFEVSGFLVSVVFIQFLRALLINNNSKGGLREVFGGMFYRLPGAELLSWFAAQDPPTTKEKLTKTKLA